ncbi:MAG: sensor histidine kinase, partial [Myxococcales bacterium]
TTLIRFFQQAGELFSPRDEFLAIASHDLKSPLNALHLQVQSLIRAVRRGESERLKPENLLPRLEQADRQIDRLVRLLATLLDVSRITAGRMDLELEDVDLAEVAREIVARSDEQLAQARCRLELRADERVVGRWDRLRLEQVLANLLSNAIKYGAGKPIEVCVESRGDRARVEVRDHGVGIAPEDQQRIFDRFERAGARRVGSFGLGLWIVRRIVDSMGGTVRVKSTAGEGACFVVELPLDPPRPADG